MTYLGRRVLKPDTRKTGVIVTVVKNYLDKKKAEREAEREARNEARFEAGTSAGHAAL